MNQRQKNKFHKAIKNLKELLVELNEGRINDYELRYSLATCTFRITQLGYSDVVELETDDTYFPYMEIEG